MSNLSNKFVVFQMHPPDSCEPFLVNGIFLPEHASLYLILEMPMTLLAVVPGLLMSESFLLRLAASRLLCW